MKTTLLSLLAVMMIPAISSAKIEDFNTMINENSQAQIQLRNDLKESLGSAQQAQAKAPKKMIEIANEFENGTNSQTKKSMLTFDKETIHYRASEAKKMNRLANEIKSADRTF